MKLPDATLKEFYSDVFNGLVRKKRNIVEWTVEEICKYEAFNLSTIPTDDSTVYEQLHNGFLDGIFLLEYDHAAWLVEEIQPSAFHDLVALVALNRRSIFDNKPSLFRAFVNHKHFGYSPLHSKVALPDTYGLVLYYEQVIDVVQLFCEVSSEEAMQYMYNSIQGPCMMPTDKEWFYKRALEQGYDLFIAEEILGMLHENHRYLYRRPNAEQHARLIYEMVYLKLHFPDQYNLACKQ